MTALATQTEAAGILTVASILDASYFDRTTGEFVIRLNLATFNGNDYDSSATITINRRRLLNGHGTSRTVARASTISKLIREQWENRFGTLSPTTSVSLVSLGG